MIRQQIQLLECYCQLLFMNIQFSSILLLTTMLTAPNATPHLPYTLLCNPDSSRRSQDCQFAQNSSTAPANNALIPSLLNQEDHNQLSSIVPHASSNDGTAKLTFQQQNGVEVREQHAPKMISIPRSYHKDGRGRKKMTIGGETYRQEHSTKGTGEGFNTSRSIPQQRSLSKLSSNYLEANLQSEEESFKKIEEKALQLKHKQKKNRQLIKQFIKEAAQQPQNLASSLSAIPPIKSKLAHRRGQSCGFPIPEEKHKSDLMRSLDRVNSQQEEDEGEINSVLGQSSEALPAFGGPSSSIMSLQEQLNLERKMKEKLVESNEQKKKQLQGQLSKAVQQCRKSQQIIAELEKKGEIQEARIKQTEQLTLHYKQQLVAKEKQIVQLTTTIQQQTIKLQQIQQSYEALQRKQEKNTQGLEILQRQSKTKNQEYNQAKRKLQKEVAQLAEDRRKSEQMYLREIQTLKQMIEAQKADKMLLVDQLNHKDKETINKQQQQLLSVYKQKNAQEDSIKALESQITKLHETVSKLTTNNQEKQQARQTLQEYLINAEDHIRKVEEKYHLVSRQLTEKNVEYDFLWIQLQESQKASANEEKIKQADSHVSLLHSLENDSPMKQEERELSHILSSSTLKDIKDLQGIMEQGEKQAKQERNPSEQEIRMSLPFSHRPSLNLPLLVDSQCSADDAILEEIEPSESKKQGKGCSILLKSEPNEAFSQQNDEIEDMLSNSNSNTSKMESSVGAFSEYSRLKSTQSTLSHKQMEQEYQNKIKNSKMMAKLGKFKPKK